MIVYITRASKQPPVEPGHPHDPVPPIVLFYGEFYGEVETFEMDQDQLHLTLALGEQVVPEDI